MMVPRDARQQYGQAFHLVCTSDKLVLLPVSKDPVKDLVELGKRAGVTRFSLSRLKEEIRKQAEKEL